MKRQAALARPLADFSVRLALMVTGESPLRLSCWAAGLLSLCRAD
jgi:hypothetical protein